MSFISFFCQTRFRIVPGDILIREPNSFTVRYSSTTIVPLSLSMPEFVKSQGSIPGAIVSSYFKLKLMLIEAFNHIITGNGSSLSGMLGKACTESKLTPVCLTELLPPKPGVGPADPFPFPG
jgi:hypothetical protein